MFYQNNRMLSPGTQTCADVEHTHVVTCKKCVFTWNAPMWSAGTHQEPTIMYLKHSYVHPQHAACGLIKRTRALKHTFLSLKHTCVPAEYTANDQGAVPGIQAGGQQEGDKGRQMNPSARRAVPDIQAGRQTNPSTQRAVTGIQAGRQPGPNKGRQRETNESVRQMKGEEPVRRESRGNPRCQEHHWVSRRRFVEHHQRIDRRFNSSVIHVCFTGGLTEPSRS